MKKIIIYLTFVAFVAILGFAASPLFHEAFLNLGLSKEQVAVSGTGSMFPTFPKAEGVSEIAAQKIIVSKPLMYRYPLGINLLNNRFLERKLNRGDIVEFENAITGKITEKKFGTRYGFVKRIVGIPGDEIELRDGYVYLNGKVISESYTAKPRSTYGGDFMPDCKKIKIPERKYIVLGDNRKASLDSRFELGYVDETDISHFLPLDDQVEYKDKWRDTSSDLEEANSATVDGADFIKNLNEIRSEKNINGLKLSPLLTNSALKRGDLNAAEPPSLENSVKSSGYRNILIAELSTKGFYDSAELLENLFEFPDSKKILLSSEYQDIGIGAVYSVVNNCPVQAVVIHLGGYKAPNYQKKDIENWKGLMENINKILPSWKDLVGIETVPQDKLNNLLSVLFERLKNAERIYQRLNNNEWLTDEETELMKKDTLLHQNAEKLINELNNQN